MRNYTLKELALYFLKLGYAGFGGPVALVNYMHRDLVEERKWISEDEYKEGLALSQLAPGPMASQLSIYLGYVHYGILGATICGVLFVVPSFIMVLLLGIAYKLYGGLTWMQAVFYGVGASVIGIIVMSSYKLTIKSIGQINIQSFKKNWLLWLFYSVGILITVITQTESLTLFIATGLIYMLVKSPPNWIRKPKTLNTLLVGIIGFCSYDTGTLGKIAWFFTKAGAFVFGSGLAIVPFLHSGVVTEYHWLTEKQFVDAVAVAMITPGPVVITVAFIGYLVNGFAGACIAALATFLPCYFFTIICAPYFKKHGNNKSIKSFVEGITASVIGSLVGAVIIIGTRSITDITTAIIAVTSILALIYIKKIQEPYIILISAIIGVILKTI
jgi:chromate transporter|nr:chromate transporter [uncultured Flavobacterium sp.]